MIIWGSKAKEARVATGTFFCPQCMADSSYSHMRVSRYFTLYFIPLFPTSTLGEYIHCHGCNGQMKNIVLQFTREQILASVQPWTCVKCGNRNSSTESQCLSCGASKYSEPPPLPSSSASEPASFAPPPLPLE
jgi:hypothetical protein